MSAEDCLEAPVALTYYRAEGLPEQDGWSCNVHLHAIRDLLYVPQAAL